MSWVGDQWSARDPDDLDPVRISDIWGDVWLATDKLIKVCFKSISTRTICFELRASSTIQKKEAKGFGQ
ncbi:hypothetical protein K3495_g10761 [Podosphaera aphanis]|nr:hypothetical protein K3495_g10761 [Podosphaera aphanis]